MDAERTIEDARCVCQDLRTLLEADNGLGEETLEEVQRLCEIERLVIDDPRFHDELQQVERYARYLFSGDHRRWARGPMPGEVFLRELLLDLVRSVDIRLASLAAMQRSVTVRHEAALARRRPRRETRAR